MDIDIDLYGGQDCRDYKWRDSRQSWLIEWSWIADCFHILILNCRNYNYRDSRQSWPPWRESRESCPPYKSMSTKERLQSQLVLCGLQRANGRSGKKIRDFFWLVSSAPHQPNAASQVCKQLQCRLLPENHGAFLGDGGTSRQKKKTLKKKEKRNADGEREFLGTTQRQTSRNRMWLIYPVRTSLP